MDNFGVPVFKSNVSKKTNPRPRVMSKTPEVRSPRLLPPIGDGQSSSTSHTPFKSPSDKSWSKYHSGCQESHSIYLDWASVKPEKKATGTASKGKSPKEEAAKAMTLLKEADEEEVMDYLDNHRQLLDRYVSSRVSSEVIESWMMTKLQERQVPLTASSISEYMRNKQKESICKKYAFTDLLKVLEDEPTELTVMWELATYMTTAIGVDAFKLYKLYPDHPTFVQYFTTDENKLPNSENSRILVRAEQDQIRFVLETARSGKCRRLSRHRDTRFPEVPVALFKPQKDNLPIQADFVMYQPILGKHGRTIYVVEMWRMQDPFKQVDEEVSSNFLVLGSLTLNYCNMYMDKKRERNMSDFLLDVVKAIFEEMVSLDQLIKRILEFAQRLVNADRASLFLVDYRNFELVSTVFDLKYEPGQEIDLEKKEIRMPINRGIAGHVALSGETMNIPDAYSDHRFNREVDEATGYRTASILCMPIKVEGSVIGVVQMVNKRDDDNFGHEDEVAFEIFATFFGLALHHARLYDRIFRKEQKYRVALEVLSYHNTCKETEVTTLMSDLTPVAVDLNDFYLDPFKYDEFEKCRCVIKMFGNLFDMAMFDLSTLTRFVLTVKKNYRTVPYHNFDHGWTVAHTMYLILMGDHHQRFNDNMRLALFVACLCHDLDHRGYTNKYMSEIASPLASMYTTSTLERHHFSISVTILQQEGHNIFSHISSEDYKEILGFIRHCILATDLAKFFPNLEKLNQLQSADPPAFDWELSAHRDLGMAIAMTAADLSASAKPWDIQIKTVKVIFEEFYDQGDKERAAGREPIPMMDRNKPQEQPSSQVGFLSQICIPCYSTLYNLLPNTKPMYTMALKNLERWQARANTIQRRLNKAAQATGSSQESDDSDILINPEKKEDVASTSDKQVEPITWEDDEKVPESVITRSGIWKNIDGGNWMDEDGVVVSDKTLRSIIRKEKDQGERH